MSYNYDAYLVPPAPYSSGVFVPPQVFPNKPLAYPELDPNYFNAAPPPPYAPGAATPQNNAPVPFAPPQRVLTQKIHDKTLELLTKADEQAANILGRTVVPLPAYTPQAAPPQGVHFAPPVNHAPAVNIDLADRSWRMFNGGDTHVHHHYHNGNEEQEQEKDQTGLRIFVGIVGLAAALATAFFLGKAVAGQEDAEDETEHFEGLKTRWEMKKDLYEDDYQSNVDVIIQRMESIYTRHQNNRVHKIALLIAAFIAGGAAFAGALVASKVLMAAGVVIGACTAAVGLYKLGYYYWSNRETKDAQAIDKALDELKVMPLVIYP